MKRFLVLLAMAWLTCLALPALAANDVAGNQAAGSDHAALIKSVNGEVKIIRAHTEIAATRGATLRVSDRIVTASDASAAIVFKDGTLLTLGPRADVAVRDYVFEPKNGKFAFSIYLAKGSAIYESGKIGKLSPQSVKVQTPKATVGVRGTRFLVEAE
jgi:hypothetical protein